MVECRPDVGGGPIEYPKNPSYVRKWWNRILHEHGHYSCYAFFLLLPSDEEARHYLREFGRELDLLSGEYCLVIGLTKDPIKKSSPTLWTTVDREIFDGHSIAASEIFDISFDKFPCLLILEDIFSSDCIIIELRDMTTDEIARKVRLIFSIIKKAVSEKNSPLTAIESHRNKESFLKAGRKIIGEIHSLTGKTFETAIGAWIKTFVK